jgi:hypothetical protein
MEIKELWEKIEEARNKEYEKIEITTESGEKIFVNIGKKEWYADYY